MSISKITPILVVESVDGALPFWREQMGYEVVHTVPHGDKTGFAILKSGESELMLQSESSLRDDLKLKEELRAGSVLLYADVKSLEQVVKRNKDGKVLIQERTTEYGATESWIKTPAGTILGLAEFRR